jgi:hypothetical protein
MLIWQCHAALGQKGKRAMGQWGKGQKGKRARGQEGKDQREERKEREGTLFFAIQVLVHNGKLTQRPYFLNFTYARANDSV